MPNKQRKKVIYFHHGDINGGAPRSLKLLLNNLNQSVYVPYVVIRSDESDASFFEETGAKVICEQKIKPFHGSTVSGINLKQIVYNFVYAFPTYFAAKRILCEQRPDIVHLNSTCLFMCAMAAKHVDRKIKVISHVREPLLPNIWGRILKIMNNRYCDQFIAIDEYDGKSVDPAGNKTEVVYNAVDFTTYNAEVHSNVLRQELNLSEDDVIFTSLARISPENGIKEIIKQWREAISDPRCHLVLVGEIPGREVDYTNTCYREIGDSKQIHIMKFRKDIPQLIASSDVIFCSFTKPHFARSIIEGAAMCKPALSVRIGGPMELVIENKTGLFYDFQSNTSLSKAVSQMADNAEYRFALGKGAERYARENFDAIKNARRTFLHY